jgi:hypothetical protein
MKRIEFLLSDVRQSTDNLDTNAVSDQELITYFNDAQDTIQALIFQANPKSNIFTKVGFIDTSASTTDNSWPLPSDIYAQNAIRFVEKLNSNSSVYDNYFAFNALQVEERRVFSGYWIEDNRIYITPSSTTPNTQDIRMTYFKKLPKWAKRAGQISSFSSGVSVTLAVGADTDLDDKEDYFTVVAKDGTIKLSGLNLNGYDNNTRVITTDSTLTGIANGDYVVLGQYATTHTLLPDACEALVKDYVRLRVHNRNANSGEMKNQNYFTEEQKNIIIGIFSDNQKEILYPPVTDSDYVRI